MNQPQETSTSNPPNESNSSSHPESNSTSEIPSIHLMQHLHSGLQHMDKWIKKTVGPYPTEYQTPEDLAKAKKNLPPIQKKRIKEAACANCVEPHYELLHCITKGTWFEQFTGCYSQNKAYNLCVKKQEDLLFQLGYGKDSHSEEENRKIQMEAEKKVQFTPSLPELQN